MTHPLLRAPLSAQARIATPLGTLTAWATERGLAALWFDDQAHLIDGLRAPDDAANPHVLAAQDWLEAFWSRRPLPAVELDAQGTAFQQAVWRALSAIPAGQTCSYGAIARAIGSPQAVRAVGGAIGRNPLSLIVPCHRVIGSDGTLTGYAGGLERKRRLLSHEGALPT